jgi:site-specific recombinase XerD
MPDPVAAELELLHRSLHPDAVDPDPDELVFADPRTGQPFGWRTLYEHLRTALTGAQLDGGYGFHSLRHSYGTALAAQGIPMRTLQELMGHKDIQTTQRYADYSPNPAERTLVEAAFARGQGNIRGNMLPAPEATESN